MLARDLPFPQADETANAEVEAYEIDPTEAARDEAAIAEYEAKGGVSHESVVAWVASWGGENELPRPKIGD